MGIICFKTYEHDKLSIFVQTVRAAADQCGQQDGKINVPKYGDLNNHLRRFVANTDHLNSEFLQIRANSGQHNSIKGNSGA